MTLELAEKNLKVRMCGKAFSKTYLSKVECSTAQTNKTVLPAVFCIHALIVENFHKMKSDLCYTQFTSELVWVTNCTVRV